MGTRHLICVVVNDEYKIAQYGQWDGYPSGQGVEILKFLGKIKNKNNRKKFIENLNRCKMGNANYFRKIENIDNWHNEYPWLSRDAGSEILNMVYNMDSIPKEKLVHSNLILCNSISFAGDSVFCEYAYVIDLDKNKLEVYKGFNKNPIMGERFSCIEKEKETEWHPIKLWKKFSLNKLPTTRKFLSILKEKNDE